MSLFPWTTKLSVLAGSALLCSLFLAMVSLPFIALGAILQRLLPGNILVSVVIFIPTTMVLATTMLVLADNFSLTLFGYGVRNASDASIYLYRALTVSLLLYAVWLTHGLWTGQKYKNALPKLAAAAAVIVLSSFPLLWVASPEKSDDEAEQIVAAGENPNIIILSGDGIAANHMSFYGYERVTTPFLDSIRNEFLVAENHFSNASDTGGSVISLLSGKLPTTTRVVYPPDVLRGNDSYQHLPGLLKKIGYYNADISMRHYADPYDLNLRGGFDEANFRVLHKSDGTPLGAIRKIPALNFVTLLIDRMSERITQRLEHIWNNKPMQDPLAEVNVPSKRWITDPMRLEEIRRFISDGQQPFFLHVHTMGTHGDKFRPSIRFFSTDADYETLWSVDGYDDAILDFDRLVESVYRMLEEKALLDSTMLLITSDHGFNHNALERVPMMLRVPNNSLAGSLGGNSQRLDIAPTILDLLNIRTPSWMEGESLLKRQHEDSNHPFIFVSGSRGGKSTDGKVWTVSTPQPPWYSLGRLYLVYCDQGFAMQLETMEIMTGGVAGSTASCKKKITLEEAKQIMLTHLKEKGYKWD